MYVHILEFAVLLFISIYTHNKKKNNEFPMSFCALCKILIKQCKHPLREVHVSKKNLPSTYFKYYPYLRISRYLTSENHVSHARG